MGLPFIDPEVPLKLFDPNETREQARECERENCPAIPGKCDATLRNEAGEAEPELPSSRQVFGND